MSHKKALILDEDIVIQLSDNSISWDASDQDWFYIQDGMWILEKGIIWDGATGVPDGDEDPKKPGFPVTWLASLCHDVGLAYLDDDFPHTKKEIDKIFYKLLRQANFKYAWVYYAGVRTFGSIWSSMFDWLQDTFNLERKYPAHVDDYTGMRAVVFGCQ